MPLEIDFCTLPGLPLKLFRYPVKTGETLRAWDAADEYLLSYLAEDSTTQKAQKILVVNDSFGAVTLGLKRLPPFKESTITLLSDSAISHRAIEENAVKNSLDIVDVKRLNSFDFNSSATQDKYDLVLIKIPKSLAHLEDNLRRIAPNLHSNSRIISASMVKNVHNSTLALFEKYLGPTRTSLAKKKARLIFCNPECHRAMEEKAAKSFSVKIESSETTDELQLHSYPGVFSHGSLDYGTEFMLQSMQLPNCAHISSLDILDLGCGTGVLGIVAAKRLLQQNGHMQVNLSLVDESFAAIASAQENMRNLLPPNPANQCLATHCLEGIAENSQDLILNNPPFHDASARTSAIALEMFLESKRVLRDSGQLQVVANRHLGYHKRLKEIFENCVILASNPKFIVLRAVKQPESSHA